MASWLVLIFALAGGAIAASPDTIGWEHGSEPGSMRWSPCKACEWSIRSIQDFIADPSHQEVMAEAIDTVACSFQAPAGKQFCKHDVKAALTHAVHLLEDYVSPRVICKAACKSNASGAAMLSSTFEKYYPECSYCTFAAQQSNAGERTAVLGTLSSASKSLPAPFADLYGKFVESNGENLVRIMQASGPKHACVQAGHCEVPGIVEAFSQSSAPEELSAAVADLASSIGQLHMNQECNSVRQTNVVGSEECDFCKMAVLEIRDKISDPVFQSNVEKYLRTVCVHLGDYKGICVEYIDEYLPIAFALTEEYLDPERACQMVHLCPSGPH